ncbi:MAG: class I SAM-dependent methyltransferase [Christensenellaceae bacterium]|nr:class I SAM-dependent methyltransferase [Christensenellaceae bacterium]
MSEQYFDSTPTSVSSPVTIDIVYDGEMFKFVTDSGVFSKGALDKGTQILLNSIDEPLSGNVLDLGCGWGAVGIILSKLYKGINITMADINKRAVELANINAKKNRALVKIIESDGFQNIDGSFNYIFLNPPIRAGKKIVYNLFSGAAKHLKPGGALYIVMRKRQGAPSAKEYLKSLFENVDTINRKAGYHIIKCKEAKNGI